MMFLYFFIIVLGLFLSVIFGILIMLPIILFLIVTTIHLMIVRKKYVKNHINTPKSLSFAMRSIRQKKIEFMAINKMFFLSPTQKVILKKLSILVDNLFFESKKIKFEEDYFGDPSYSISVTNMFHDHKKPH